MLLEGQSRKMQADLGEPIQYFLRLGESSLGLNRYIGKDIQLTFLGQITCVGCGRITKKSFAQGYCYPCMQSSPENSECIIRPELCRGHLGEGRDLEWEQEFHVCEHVVYVAASSAMKVGVTRGTGTDHGGLTKARAMRACWLERLTDVRQGRLKLRSRPRLRTERAGRRCSRTRSSRKLIGKGLGSSRQRHFRKSTINTW